MFERKKKAIMPNGPAYFPVGIGKGGFEEGSGCEGEGEGEGEMRSPLIKTCLKCKVKKVEYEAVPCGHRCMCKGCAMKMATGGKCKVCGELFGELRRIRK